VAAPSSNLPTASIGTRHERALVCSNDRVGFARELERIAGAASVRVRSITYAVQGRRVTALN
jgi:hypothetical protein